MKEEKEKEGWEKRGRRWGRARGARDKEILTILLPVIQNNTKALCEK